MKPIGLQKLILHVAHNLALRAVRFEIGKGHMHLHSSAAINKAARTRTPEFIGAARIRLGLDKPKDIEVPKSMGFDAAVTALRRTQERVVFVKRKPEHGKW